MQKTAYEMRISDWSSDVCSSYLLEGEGFRPWAESMLPALGSAVVGGVAPTYGGSGASEAWLQATIAYSFPMEKKTHSRPISLVIHGGAGVIERDQLDLGRACCMERVFQYVLFPAVITTLKKTYKH